MHAEQGQSVSPEEYVRIVNKAILMVLQKQDELLLSKATEAVAESARTQGLIPAAGIASVLSLVEAPIWKPIARLLEAEDAGLGRAVAERMLCFEDVVHMDDRAVQQVLRQIDAPLLARALKAVSAQVQDKIFRNMSKRAVEILREDMHHMGPIRLADAEDAQREIAAIMRRLEDQGTIVIVRSEREDLTE